MRVVALLRGWVGALLAAIFFVAVAAMSCFDNATFDNATNSAQPIPRWLLALLAASFCAAVALYEYVRHPSGRPRKERKVREDPDVGELLIYGILAATVLASVVVGFRLMLVLHKMQ